LFWGQVLVEVENILNSLYYLVIIGDIGFYSQCLSSLGFGPVGDLSDVIGIDIDNSDIGPFFSETKRYSMTNPLFTTGPSYQGYFTL